MSDAHPLRTELQSLRHRLRTMTDVVDAQLAHMLNALLEHDTTLAAGVVQRDREVDALELDIDRHCERILALYTPVAADLRMLIFAVKVNTDLERIGDHCRNIARKTPHLPSDPAAIDATRIPAMADLVRTMLRRAQEAFRHHDRLLARKVIAMDLQVNRLHHENENQLFARLASDAARAPVTVHLLAISKALERIGDHTKNIAGNVVFLIEGTDLRRRARDISLHHRLSDLEAE